MARFFIDRPIFAWVIAILIMFAGIISLTTLPQSQYPSIAPPEVTIRASYPGASAKTVEDTVTQVIEQQMSGIDHYAYMTSSSSSNGTADIKITFTSAANPDTAQVQVQNKLQLAMPMLPSEVQRQGVSVSKSSGSFLMVVAFYTDAESTEEGKLTARDLADYVSTNIENELSRVEGVGAVQLFGATYAMRIWLDPYKLYEYNLTAGDIRAAISAQNAQVSAGQLGGTPALPGTSFNVTVTAQTRLSTASQFENLFLRVNPDGSQVYLKDVARVELGNEDYSVMSRYKGNPAVGLAIELGTGANALQTVTNVQSKLKELSAYFPAELRTSFPFDSSPFVRASIASVIATLLEAIGLVFLVMYLFLQNFRATIIPTLAVPVVLLGTFAVLNTLGFSINTLTMFAMVLAIGLLVDDAIVVVENVERLLEGEKLSPRDAARKSMDQITGALVGIGIVISAVFVPMAFLSGSTGVIYRQFSVTIVSAMTLSVIIAIIFTPALCATMLQSHDQRVHGKKSFITKFWDKHIAKYADRFFNGFNKWFDKVTAKYRSGVGIVVKRIGRFFLIYVGALVILGFLYVRLPTSFIPDEDQGILFTMVQLPPTQSMEMTDNAVKIVEQYYLEQEKEAVDGFFMVVGFSFAGSGQNNAFGFIQLKDWKERNAGTRPNDVFSVAGRASEYFYVNIPGAMAFAFPPPAILELGTSSGFNMFIQDRAGIGHDALMAEAGKFMGLTAQPQNARMLTRVRPNGQADGVQKQLVIDRAKAQTLSVSLAEINDTIAAAWGGSYVDDFIDKGRIKKVYMQGDAQYRMKESDIESWYVRNDLGEMVGLKDIVHLETTYGSPHLQRYNGYPAVEFIGEAVPGVSSGTAMDLVEDLIGQLAPGTGFEWTNLSYQERLAGDTTTILLAISLLVVFLCLAALYESWSVPAAILLAAPLGVLGAVLAITLRGMDNNIYFQVGILTTVGLSAKNAILIVEFAKEMYDDGMDLITATKNACKMRLRPIIMTSLAFGFGVLPLALASGAGSTSQNIIGTGVLFGTLASTILGIFFVPLFFVAIMKIFPSKKRFQNMIDKGMEPKR